MEMNTGLICTDVDFSARRGEKSAWHVNGARIGSYAKQHASFLRSCNLTHGINGAADLFQFLRANVRAVRKAKVDERKLAPQVGVGKLLAVLVHQLKRPTNCGGADADLLGRLRLFYQLALASVVEVVKHGAARGESECQTLERDGLQEQERLGDA